MKSLYNFLAKVVFFVVLSYIYFYIKQDLEYIELLSYGFILGAYLMFIATPYFVKNMTNKTVQEMPVYAVSFIYLIVQLIIAFYISYYIVIIGVFDYNTYYLIQAIITGVYLIILLSILYVNEQTYSNLQKQYIDNAYIKEVKTELKLLLNKTTDNTIRTLLENIIDLTAASPSKSYKDFINLENNIIDEINHLKTLIDNSSFSEEIYDKCSKIENMINERNTKIKLMHYKK